MSCYFSLIVLSVRYSHFFFQETYKPKRVYKKPVAYAKADEGVQVQSTLLEYGQKYVFTSKAGKEDSELNEQQKSVVAGLTKITEAAEEASQEEDKKIQTLMESMSETERQQVRNYLALA